MLKAARAAPQFAGESGTKDFVVSHFILTTQGFQDVNLRVLEKGDDKRSN